MPNSWTKIELESNRKKKREKITSVVAFLSAFVISVLLGEKQNKKTFIKFIHKNKKGTRKSCCQSILRNC